MPERDRRASDRRPTGHATDGSARPPYERRADDTGGATTGAPAERKAGGASGGGDGAETKSYGGPERRSPRTRPSERRRWRQLLNRWKEPIIGLTVAGAAAPLIHAARPGRGAAAPARPLPGQRADTLSGEATPTAQYTVAQEWRRAAERRMRELTIAGAVAHYDISQSLARKIFDAAVQEGIEPDLGYGLVNTESTFRHDAVSSVGARGLTQLMPRTARWILGTRNTPDLFDADLNLRAGFRYLRHLIDRYHGNIRLALTAYNRGPGTVNRILERGGDPDNGYAARVLDE